MKRLSFKDLVMWHSIYVLRGCLLLSFNMYALYIVNPHQIESYESFKDDRPSYCCCPGSDTRLCGCPELGRGKADARTRIRPNGFVFGPRTRHYPRRHLSLMLIPWADGSPLRLVARTRR